MKKFLAGALIIGNLFFMPISHAEVKTYTGVGEYSIGERDTLEIAKQGAKEKAMRNALEKAGVLLQSHSRTEDLQLVEDVITSRTGAILKVLEVVYERTDLVVRATVKVDIDADDLNHRLQVFESSGNNSSPAKTEDDPTSKANNKLEEAVGLMHQGIFDGVLPLLNEAMNIDSNNVIVYEKLGLFYKETKDYPNAISNYDKAIKLNSSNEQVYRGRAECYEAVGEKDKARADLALAKKVAASNQKLDEARKLCEAEDFDAAAPVASEALTLNQNNAFAWEMIGSIYNGKLEYDKAIFYYEKAIVLNPNIGAAYSGLGQAYMEMGKYDKAILNFSKAIEFRPFNASAWIYRSRGECYKSVGENKKAQADFVRAKQLGWVN